MLQHWVEESSQRKYLARSEKLTWREYFPNHFKKQDPRVGLVLEGSKVCGDCTHVAGLSNHSSGPWISVARCPMPDLLVPRGSTLLYFMAAVKEVLKEPGPTLYSVLWGAVGRHFHLGWGFVDPGRGPWCLGGEEGSGWPSCLDLGSGIQTFLSRGTVDNLGVLSEGQCSGGGGGARWACCCCRLQWSSSHWLGGGSQGTRGGCL